MLLPVQRPQWNPRHPNPQVPNSRQSQDPVQIRVHHRLHPPHNLQVTNSRQHQRRVLIPVHRHLYLHFLDRYHQLHLSPEPLLLG